MRAAILMSVALAATAGHAAPLASTGPMADLQPGLPTLDTAHPGRAALDLSGHERFIEPTQHTDLPLLGPERAPPVSGSGGFAIGPFHADTVTKFSRRGGKAHVAPHYRLDGVSVFGGAIGGSVDGRGGMLTLQWKTGS
jgi:hypothetical protein